MPKNPTDQRNQQTGNQSNQRTRQDGNKETNPNDPKATNPNNPKATKPSMNEPKGDPTRRQQQGQGSGKTGQQRDENSPISRKNQREFPVTDPVQREMDDITADDDQLNYDDDDQDNDQDTDLYEDDDDDAGIGRTSGRSTDPGRKTFR